MSELPQMMPAAVYRSPGVVEVEDRPVPDPGEFEVLIEVDHCGICGSDVHVLYEGWGNQPGMIAGHEFTGVIAGLGSGVTQWSVGEEVVIGASPKCGRCRRCLENKPSQCENREAAITGGGDGAFARYCLVPSASLLRLPEGLSSREAALAEPMAVALHGITRSGIAHGDTAMIIGAGPIGALALAALVSKGIGPISVVEPNEGRRTLATALGATEVLEPADLEVFPPWEPEKISSRAVDVVLECSGKKTAIESGFHQLRRGGTLVLIGAGIEAPALDPNRAILNELHVCGSFIYDEHGFEDALALLASGRIPNHLLIESNDISLDGISQALDGLAKGRIAAKVMVNPRLATKAPS